MDQTVQQGQIPPARSLQNKQPITTVGGLRKFMPGTTLVLGRRLPGQLRQLGPGQQGRLVAGVPLQAVIAAAPAYTMSATSLPRVSSVCTPVSVACSGIAALRRQPSQLIQQHTSVSQRSLQLLQEATMQIKQQPEEQQGSTAGFWQDTEGETVDMGSEMVNTDNMGSDSEAHDESEAESELLQSQGLDDQEGTPDEAEDFVGNEAKRRRLSQEPQYNRAL